MSGAREDILGRVRAALETPRTPGRADAAVLERGIGGRAASVRPAMASDFHQQFRAKAEANLMRVRDLASIEDVPRAVADILAESNVAPDISVAPALASLVWPRTMTVRAGKARLDEKITVSLATSGIAETGSVVLCSGAAGPSSLSFAAEVHVIVLARAAIAAYLEDGLKAVSRTQQRWPRAVNVISGPSRTADVAGIVVRPAHGPKAVYLLITG